MIIIKIKLIDMVYKVKNDAYFIFSLIFRIKLYKLYTTLAPF